MLRLAAILATVFTQAALFAQDRVAGHLLLFNDNGAWSWFEDERAIVDRSHRRLLVGSCADSSGFGGTARGGDIDVAWLDLDSGRIRTFELHDRLQGDDHDSPALMVRPDGRILAMYGKHGSDRLARWRATASPGDPSQWSAEQTLTNGAGLTYSNLHHLAAANGLAGITYDFTRTVNFDPNVLVSHDLGDTWSYGGKLLTEGGSGDRPYLKYASDGWQRVHLLATERHPRNFANSIYHGYVEDRTLYDSTGQLVDGDVLDASGQPPSRLTQVFATGTVFSGVPLHRAWTIDLALDRAGRPRALIQARARDLDTDHRLLFAQFDGMRWSTFEVCRLGPGLYSPENDYTGLAALHPDDADRIYVSTPIDPRTGSTLGHHEIFAAVTPDGGRTWSFTPVTEASSVDNLRPIVPSWGENRTALLWLRGTYTTYTDYDVSVVGTVDAPELRLGAITYGDATRANTALASGGTFNPTGPSSNQGTTDGRWHERTGWGNGGSVLTSDEQGDEDVPMLRTRLTGLIPGRYDAFVFFWSNPNDAWLIRAGLESVALRTFQKQGSEAVEVADTTTPIVLTGPTVVLYKAYLGRYDVGPSGHLDVFVDDLATGQMSGTRTWYDGIGYAPVQYPASTLEVGVPCGAGPAELDVVGAPTLGGSMTLTVTSGQPGSISGLVFGYAIAPTALGAFGFPSCTLYPNVLGTDLLGIVSAGGQSRSVTIGVPNDPALLRAHAVFQGAVYIGPTQLQLTTARVVTVGR